MPAKGISKIKKNRIYWMDNLRTVIILLVVLYHVGGVYEAAGLWVPFWIVVDPDTISWVGIAGIFIDIFIMATLFFISGYLAPASMEKKSERQFLIGKIKRLMIPWAIAVLTLIPIYRIIFYYSRGLPQEAQWLNYIYFNTPNSQNWLWFLPLLFLFNVIYLLFSKVKIKLPEISLSWATAGSFVLAMAYSFIVGGLVGFRTWTLTPVLDFENERLLVYFLAFLLGALSYQRNTFAELPKSKTPYIVANSVAWLPVTGHIFARLWPFFYPEGFVISPLYRFAWYFTFHLSLLTMVYVLIESFWRYLDKTGPVWQELNRNSYGVYIIHVIMIGIFGTLLLGLNIPALVKYPLLILAAYLGSNLIVSAYRRVKSSLSPIRQPEAVIGH